MPCRMPFKFRVIYDVVFMVVRREKESRRGGKGDPGDRYRRGAMRHDERRVFGIFPAPCIRLPASRLSLCAFNFVLIFYTARNLAARDRTLVNRELDRRALYPVIYRCKSISRKATLLAIARWRMIRQTAFSAYNTPRFIPSHRRTGLRTMRLLFRSNGPSFPFIDTQNLSPFLPFRLLLSLFFRSLCGALLLSAS